MAAPKYTDRVLAAEVRSLALKQIKEVLLSDPSDSYELEFKRAVLLKLSSTVLPRINEHTGEDGDAIKVDITKINYILPNGNNSTPNAETTPSV